MHEQGELIYPELFYQPPAELVSFVVNIPTELRGVLNLGETIETKAGFRGIWDTEHMQGDSIYHNALRAFQMTIALLWDNKNLPQYCMSCFPVSFVDSSNCNPLISTSWYFQFSGFIQGPYIDRTVICRLHNAETSKELTDIFTRYVAIMRYEGRK